MSKQTPKGFFGRNPMRQILLYFCLVVGAVIVFFPIFWMISLSFQDSTEIYSTDINIFPKQITLSNYIIGLAKAGFSKYILNSLLIASSVALLSVFINSMAGFALAKYNFPGRDVIFLVILSAIMLPAQVVMVPLYLLVSKVGWVDNLLGAIIPVVSQTFGVLVMRQYCLTIPQDLIEAATLDGCSDFRAFWQIVFPLCKPAVAVNVIFQFMWRWNDLLWPLIVLRKENLYTVQQALAFFKEDVAMSGGPIIAMSIISMLPIVVLFFALQDYFVQGIAMTGLKE